MESLSRPPHRRKQHHSSSSFSLKSPYDDVVLLPNSKAKPFDAHEYAEIFSGGSGGSSIPVLDLSGLDERVGSGKLDYSNIFGGLRNDDVAVPYQDLFSNGSSSAKRTRTNTNTRPQGDPQPPLQESGSPSGKTKSSAGEASDQSIDGAKQQFNLSFNKTRQLNSDVTNGKTHIAQFHAVRGFTYFVDQTPRPQKKEDNRLAPPLKRGVSRTWSFSAEVESLKGKGGLHIPDKSHNVNEVNLKPHPSKVPLPSTRPSNPNDNMENRQSRLPSFSSKEDAPLKTSGEHSPPPLDEDLDENSVAGVSAAALKRAIEQAQESIRIAKMIMERKKESLQDGPKPRSKGRMRVGDKKESMVDRESYGSKERNIRENYERLDPVNPTPTGDGKLSPSLSHSDEGIKGGKIDLERVWDNVEAAREHREPLSDGKNIVSSSSRSETHYFAGKAELENQGGAVETVREHREPFISVGEKVGPSRSRSEAPEMIEFKKQQENVESVDAHREAMGFRGIVDTAESRAVNSVSEKVANNENFTLSMSDASPREDIGVGKKTLEQGQGTFNLTNIVQLARSTFQKMPTLRKSVTETSQQRQATVDQSQGAENVSDLVEWVFSTSDIPPHQGKNMDEEGAAMRISQEDNVVEERENAPDDKEKHEKKFQESEEMDNWEYARESEFSTSNHESQSLVEIDVLDQEKTLKNSESVHERKEHGQSDGKRYEEKENGMKRIEAHHGFESEKQLEEDLEEQTMEGKLEVSPERGVVEGGATGTFDPEIDEKKLSDAHDEDGLNLPGEFQQIEESSADPFEHEAAEFIQMEANNCAELQQDEEIQDIEEANHSLGEAKNVEQKQNKCDFQEAAYEKDNDAVDSKGTSYAGTIFSDAHNSDMSTVYDATQEAHDVNRAEEHQITFKCFEDNVGGVPETFSAIDKDKAAEQLFHLGEIKTPETDCLRRSVSEENFVGSKLHNAFEALSSNGKKENGAFVDADFEELRKDQDAFTTDAIHDDAMGSRQKLPEIHPSENKSADFDLTCSRQVSEQTSESEGGSVSGSSIENIDWMLAHECQGSEEKVNNDTLNKGEVKDDHETAFSERKCTEERRDVAYSEEQSEGVNSEEQSEGVDPEEQSEGVDPEEQSEGVDSEEQSEGVDSEEQTEGINYEDKIEGVNSEEQREELHSQSHSEPTEMDKSMEAKRSVGTSQNIEKTKENITGISTKVKKDAKESTDNFNKDDQQQRIEAIKRGREREKDRLVVERAIREARERAFAEARERAERAAVERAAAEARQRAMTEAREKLEKASTEAKIRAERAAVERATSEARERAREKAMSQKASTDARTQIERNSTERFSSSSRENVLKHSFSSSDLEKFSEANTESAQRRNLRLERHQRIMERAAKALAEKNMRDLIAQKEQAERNRLAESLDADIKRWAMGKEGNLRALLSTLQYILGPDSGWQPISLTEIITTAAVKKAYRKATLYVHPDKLQQRGASIKQKYICEKIFDLLKAAWNRFNSEER